MISINTACDVSVSVSSIKLSVACFLLLGVALIFVSEGAEAENYDVEITDDMEFDPEEITIYVGDTITWTNNDGMSHTATSTSGPTSFDSGNIASGGNWSFTFTQDGTYNYKCDYHSSMTGKIIVKTNISL